ncbi:glycosyltransferase [Clostridium perfringens]|uniref:glycosyltransferase n=1 Tax=Clostridium perfringens TaxID=1502 RepID=UPI0039EC3C79|nr:glycosyltransferase [Clostridium perfringens]
MRNILVSINCITYNHEKYIGEALESFMMQKTNFDFEIIVSDDFSTDNTVEVVKKFQKKYPNKIRLIEGKKNIGARQNGMRAHNNSLGKYVAICEGDDYWTDCNKLQKQINYMEKNRDCSMVFHNAEKINDKTKKSEGFMINKNLNSKKILIKDFFDLQFIPTASILYKKELKDNMPSWYMDAITGDFPFNLILIANSYAYYMNDVMSVYRVGNSESMMGKWKSRSKSLDFKINHAQGYLDILNNFNEFSSFKYDDLIKEEIKNREFEILIDKGNLREIKSEKYKENYNKMSKKSKMKTFIISISPRLFDILSKIRG